MVVNEKLTTARKTIVVFLMLLAVAAVLAVPTYAFSEIYGNQTAEEAETETFLTDLGEGPVDVTLVMNGNAYDYTYFPVECTDFLAYAGVTLTEIDSLNVASDTILYDNMMIDVSTVAYNEYTVEEPMSCGYDLVEVDTIPKGEMKILTEGVAGLKKVTYIEKCVDGVTVEREVIGEEVVIPCVNGTAEYGVGGTVTASDGTTYAYSYKKYMEATAYTYVPGLTTMTTATGATLAKGIVAVDPKVIPLHTKMYITSDSVEYGVGVAEDTGGAIKGDIVDLAFMSYDECIQFGRRTMWVYILE